MTLGPGRPRLPQGVRKRHTQTVRLNDEMRAWLQTNATGAQRSISEEIEFQLYRARDLAPILERLKV